MCVGFWGMGDGQLSNVALGAAICQIREREGLTQEMLAFRAGNHPTWVSRVESGERDARWSSIAKLVDGLGVNMLEVVALAERLELD